jgi:MYXO-CTERM domain-containing protein
VGNRVIWFGLVGMLGGACADQLETSTTDQASTVCGTGSTVKGMDVSYYETSIDWARAKAAGIDFSFIRVSDGTTTIDTKFAQYWAGAKSAGVLRGAYQFFRPNQDAIAQADLLLSMMGTLQPGDLPPVLDVEVSGGMTKTQVAAGVHTWIDHVTAATGVAPIVYAGLYSWPDLTGSADVTTSPLWVAQYTSAACPNIPSPWTKWMFWQHSSTGSVDGVTTGGLDLNVFNGTLDELKAYAASGSGGGSGGGPAASCGTIEATGATIDDSDACFSAGGPAQYMRRVATAGMNGLQWTHTTRAASEANYGQWNLDFAAAGTYHVEVYTSPAYATSQHAAYLVQANGAMQSVTIDQTKVDGWQALGDIAFAAGGEQFINLGDNTGEASQAQLVFDAVRVTPVAGRGYDNPTPTPEPGGCSTTGSSGGGMGLALLGLGLARLRRRR